MTWVYEAALLVTGMTAVYGVAHSLAWRTGKEWVSVAGACVAAFLIGWALVPRSPVSLPGLLQTAAIFAVAAGCGAGCRRRLRERGAAEGARRP